jgi:hypothetical protein
MYSRLLFICSITALALSPIDLSAGPVCDFANSTTSILEEKMKSAGCLVKSRGGASTTLECPAADSADKLNAIVFDRSAPTGVLSFLNAGYYLTDTANLSTKERCLDVLANGAPAFRQPTSFGAIFSIPIEQNKNSVGAYHVIAVNGTTSSEIQQEFLLYVLSSWAENEQKNQYREYVFNNRPNDDYETSEVFSFGLRLSTTTLGAFETRLTERGWSKSSDDCYAEGGIAFGCLEQTVIFKNTIDESGIKEVLVDSFGDRIQQVDYVFDSLESYTAYYIALDEKYGSSTRQVKDGCTGRKWDSGVHVINGYFCANKKDKFKIEILNFEIFDRSQLSRIATEVVLQPKRDEPRNQLPADMY